MQPDTPGQAPPPWQTMSVYEKCTRHRRAAEAAELEAVMCRDSGVRRHALNNAMQHRCAIMEIEERYGTLLLYPAWRV